MSTIAVYGGSFNPPGLHHRHIARELARHFDSVVVVPCGPRPDKAGNDSVGPVYRAAMTDLAFGGIPGVEVDLFDLEQATFTRTHELDTRYRAKGDVWHVVGADLIAGGGRGHSFIHRNWLNGPHLWRTLNFAVINRSGYDLIRDDLPPRHRFIPVGLHGSQFAMRERLFRGESLQEMATPDVAAYIGRHGLYRGSVPARVARVPVTEPRVLVVADERNPKAAAWAKQFAPFVNEADPNLIVVIGGDGTMLRAIHEHWRKRVPFFGVNAGHLGFLLNEAADVVDGRFPPPEIVLRQMPLLYVEMELPDGSWKAGLTFNDAWVERSTGQSAWLKVTVDGQERLAKLVCDGVLVSTAAGSTAYAQSMGAQPLLADTPAWLLVGSNVMRPLGWKSALLSSETRVEVASLDSSKRPIQGFLYGSPVGEVRGMRARLSRIATAELAFCPNHDMAEKITRLQFPKCE